jgi:hypothetical protein
VSIPIDIKSKQSNTTPFSLYIVRNISTFGEFESSKKGSLVFGATDRLENFSSTKIPNKLEN